MEKCMQIPCERYILCTFSLSPAYRAIQTLFRGCHTQCQQLKHCQLIFRGCAAPTSLTPVVWFLVTAGIYIVKYRQSIAFCNIHIGGHFSVARKLKRPQKVAQMARPYIVFRNRFLYGFMFIYIYTRISIKNFKGFMNTT